MSEALVLPTLRGGAWQRRTKNDRAALALADRHYSRRKPGSGQIGPPGRKLVFVTPCERAVWLTHWPDPAMTLDGEDAWRCSIFRNEGAGLSSDLIIEAMLVTARCWTGRPSGGWLTWIDPKKVRSTNPGFCFEKAGWWRDGVTGRGLIRMRAEVLG